MLDALRLKHRRRLEDAAISELPIAALAALTANINRDPKKGKPFTPLDFCLYRKEHQSDDGKDVFRPEVALIAMDLQSQQQAPKVLLCAWSEILASARDGTEMPDVRALRSDDEAVWVIAPTWEDRNVRGGLVAVHGLISGPIRVRDIDRPLISYVLRVPERKAMAWLEADLLLAAET